MSFAVHLLLVVTEVAHLGMLLKARAFSTLQKKTLTPCHHSASCVKSKIFKLKWRIALKRPLYLRQESPKRWAASSVPYWQKSARLQAAPLLERLSSQVWASSPSRSSRTHQRQTSRLGRLSTTCSCPSSELAKTISRARTALRRAFKRWTRLGSLRALGLRRKFI
jgi:hypothetical protein